MARVVVLFDLEAKDKVSVAFDKVGSSAKKAKDSSDGFLKTCGQGIQTLHDSVELLGKGFDFVGRIAGSVFGGIADLIKDLRPGRALANDWDEFTGAVGRSIASSKSADTAFRALSLAGNQLQNVFASDDGKHAVDTFFRALAGGAAAAINAGLGAIKFWETAVIPLLNNARINWQEFWGGDDFLVEPLDVQADAAKQKVMETFQDLADNLAAVGAGKAVKLPALFAPASKEELKAIEENRARAFKTGEDMLVRYYAHERELQEMSKAREEEFARARDEARRRDVEAEKAANEAKFQDLVQKYDERQRSLERGFRGMAEGIAGGVISVAETAFSGVNEVVDGKLKTVNDAVGQFLSGLGSRVAAWVTETLAQIAIIGALDVLTGGLLSGGKGLLGIAKGVLGFAGGGFVTGGVPGRDSVPAMLMPGEFVLPVHVVDAIRRGQPPGRATGPVQHFASGGMVSHASGRTGGDTYNINLPPIGLMALPPSYEMARYQRDNFGRVQSHLARLRG